MEDGYSIQNRKRILVDYGISSTVSGTFKLSQASQARTIGTGNLANALGLPQLYPSVAGKAACGDGGDAG